MRGLSIERLRWDSQLFGCEVVQLHASALGSRELCEAIEAMRAGAITLASWNVDPKDVVSNASAGASGAPLAYQKVTYLKGPLMGYFLL